MFVSKQGGLLMSQVVLVVDDEPLINMGVTESLRDGGFDVISAYNAEEALALLEAHPEITTIFTDIAMPGNMDGLKLAAAVRDRWPPIHIIITSGHETPMASDMPERAVFIPKPYFHADVVDAVRFFA